MASYDLPENITVKREGGGGGSVDLKHRNKTNFSFRESGGGKQGRPPRM